MADGDHIIACVLANDFEAVDAILAAHPDRINAQWGGNGVTPLMAATGRGLTDMAAYLLSKEGIDLSIRDNSGRIALDYSLIFPEIQEKIIQAMYGHLRNWREPRPDIV